VHKTALTDKVEINGAEKAILLDSGASYTLMLPVTVNESKLPFLHH
jgi:hypothetical protein